MLHCYIIMLHFTTLCIVLLCKYICRGLSVLCVKWPRIERSNKQSKTRKTGRKDLQSILNTTLQNESIESFVYLLRQASGWIPTITIPLKYINSSTYINVTSFTHETKPSKGLLDSFPSPPQCHIKMWVDRWWNRSLGVPPKSKQKQINKSITWDLV
jgi:hypothetical protein